MRSREIVLILGVVSSFLTFGSKIMSADDEAQHESPPLVITPGGPKSPDQVHTVEPGTHVEINPDGTYSIVPDRNADDPKGPDSTAGNPRPSSSPGR
jgi:hypothetical protein